MAADVARSVQGVQLRESRYDRCKNHGHRNFKDFFSNAQDERRLHPPRGLWTPNGGPAKQTVDRAGFGRLAFCEPCHIQLFLLQLILIHYGQSKYSRKHFTFD